MDKSKFAEEMKLATIKRIYGKHSYLRKANYKLYHLYIVQGNNNAKYVVEKWNLNEVDYKKALEKRYRMALDCPKDANRAKHGACKMNLV